MEMIGIGLFALVIGMVIHAVATIIAPRWHERFDKLLQPGDKR